MASSCFFARLYQLMHSCKLCIWKSVFYEWKSVHAVFLTTNSTIMIDNRLFIGALRIVDNGCLIKFRSVAVRTHNIIKFRDAANEQVQNHFIHARPDLKSVQTQVKWFCACSFAAFRNMVISWVLISGTSDLYHKLISYSPTTQGPNERYCMYAFSCIKCKREQLRVRLCVFKCWSFCVWWANCMVCASVLGVKIPSL